MLVQEVREKLQEIGRIIATAPTLTTAPIGPSLREYANGAVLMETDFSPIALLESLKTIERQLGRRRYRRWGARSIDIDIILWSGGRWSTKSLVIPHPAFRTRDFVLSPLCAIAPEWRDPISGLSVRHLRARLRKATPLPRPRG